MKVIYLNKETGKEVHYGENITFKKTGTLGSGYSYESVTTVPIINNTIPYLIEKGVLVQKEVKEKSIAQNKLTIDEKLSILTEDLKVLIKKVESLEKYLYNLYNYD